MHRRKPKLLFFSYRSKDRKAVDKAARALRRLGYKIWMDIIELPPGTPFPAEIADVIVNRADHFLAFLPASGELTGWLKDEYALAKNRANNTDNMSFIVPVLLGRKPRPIPPIFAAIEQVRLPSTNSHDLRALGKAIRITIDRKTANKRSIPRKAKNDEPKPRPPAPKPPGKLDPVEEVVASITGGTNSLGAWARKLTKFLRAWSVLFVRRGKQAGWECIESTGIEKRLVKDFSRLPKQCQPPPEILQGTLFHERKEAVVPQAGRLAVNYDSRLWAPVWIRTSAKRIRVVGAIGALSSSLRSRGEFLTVDISIVKAMAAKLADRAEFAC